MNNTILQTLFLDNPEIPVEIAQFCKSLPEYIQAEQDYQEAAEEVRRLLGTPAYLNFEGQMNIFRAMENWAYYLFGLNLREEILQNFKL